MLSNPTPILRMLWESEYKSEHSEPVLIFEAPFSKESVHSAPQFSETKLQ